MNYDLSTEGLDEMVTLGVEVIIVIANPVAFDVIDVGSIGVGVTPADKVGEVVDDGVAEGVVGLGEGTP